MTTFDTVPSEVSFRDVACFTFAVALHSLLLLWKGGLLSLPDQQKLGEMIVAVDFRSEVPTWDSTLARGSAPKPHGIMQQVKSLFKHREPAAEKPALAMSQQNQQIQAPPETWNKTPETLNNKTFKRDSLQNLKEKKDDPNIAVGQTKEIVQVPAASAVKNIQPNLKQNKFRVASKDMPFAIASPKNQEALQNVNAIPMPVGRVTTPGVKSLGGDVGGAALQSKNFGSSGGGFGGSPKSSASGGGLATGSSAGGQIASANIPASGIGSGEGTGSGQGSALGSGSSSSGRSWSGGRGTSGLAPLGRGTVQGEAGSPTGMKGGKSEGFEITGALRGRGIVQKIKPPYEMDARVALRFRVGWDGRVLDGIVVEISSGSPTFDQKVIAALKQWIFVRLADNRTNEIQEGIIKFVFKGV